MSTLLPSDERLPAPGAPAAGGRVRRALGATTARILYWAPVWAPLAVLAQIALLGLGPALAESRRLGAAERVLDARLERERSERAQLERILRAQNDPLYLERERRLLRDGNGPLAPR